MVEIKGENYKTGTSTLANEEVLKPAYGAVG
jgi:hypothetical protein